MQTIRNRAHEVPVKYRTDAGGGAGSHTLTTFVQDEEEPGTPSFKRELLSLLPTLRAFAIHLSRNRDWADDLVHDTVVKAWIKQSSFLAGTNLRAWLITILRNEYYSQLRKRRREVEDVDGAIAQSVAVPANQDEVMDLADLRRALGALPAGLREAVILVGASGFSYEEAAQICKCAVGTIKSRVNRARARLRTILEASGGEPSERAGYPHLTGAAGMAAPIP